MFGLCMFFFSSESGEGAVKDSGLIKLRSINRNNPASSFRGEHTVSMQASHPTFHFQSVWCMAHYGRVALVMHILFIICPRASPNAAQVCSRRVACWPRVAFSSRPNRRNRRARCAPLLFFNRNKRCSARNDASLIKLRWLIKASQLR